MTPSTTIGVVCWPVAVTPGAGAGVVAGAADTLVIHTAPRLAMFALLI